MSEIKKLTELMAEIPPCPNIKVMEQSLVGPNEIVILCGTEVFPLVKDIFEK